MGWYFTITEEMRELGLSGNELIVFALINSYSQKGNGVFYGGISFLCEVCGVSRATAMRILQSLTENGLIDKNEIFHNGVKYITYQVGLKMRQGVSKCDKGSIKMRPNNKDIDINKRESNNKRSVFKKPSVEEVREYCEGRQNGIDPEEFIAFYESKGWMVGKNPMVDWKSAIITWEKKKKKSTPAPRPTPQKESVFQHNMRELQKMREKYGKPIDNQ